MSEAAVIDVLPVWPRGDRPESPLEVLAAKLRVKTKRAEDGEQIIPGKLGHIYEHGEGWVGLALVALADDSRLDNTLRARKRRALAAGFELWVEGDFESILLFDPADPKQARLAVRLVGAKRRRVLSPAQLAAAKKGLEASRIRRDPPAEGVEMGKTGGSAPDPIPSQGAAKSPFGPPAGQLGVFLVSQSPELPR